MKTTNKLRSAILVASFCLLNTISYGQTKEETINWLNQKLTKYCHHDICDVTIESISECQIIIKHISRINGYLYISYIPTNGMKINTNGEMSFPIEAIEIKDDSGLKSFSKSSAFSIQEVEDHLCSRIEKAVAHLATFCPKKKETF